MRFVRSAAVVCSLLLLIPFRGIPKDKITFHYGGNSVALTIVLDHSSVNLVQDAKGERMLRYDPGEGGRAAEMGMPDLPLRTVLLKLPEGGTFPRITRLSVRKEPAGKFKVPVFTVKDSAGRPLPAVVPHSAGELFPERAVEVADVITTPAGKFAKVVYFPLQYRMSEQGGIRNIAIECVIEWDNALPQFSSGSELRSTWYVQGIPYVAMAIAQDGPIRVSGAELSARGFSRSQLEGMRLFYRGVEMPLHIDARGSGALGEEDNLYFWGTRNYSGPRVAGEYSDTSVFWLASIGSGGKRFVPMSLPIASAETVSVAKDTLRFKQDRIYYPGNGQLTFQNLSEKNSGEGWYWGRLQANQQTTLTFDLSSVTLAPLTQARMFVRLQGSTAPPPDSLRPDHVIRFVLNGQVLDTVQFSGYEERMATFTFPVSRLQPGNNSLLISNLRSTFNEVLVEYVEVEVVKQLRLQNGSLAFAGSGVGPVATFRVSNLQDTSVTVLKLFPQALRLTNVRFEASGSTYNLVFADSLKGGDRYAIFSAVGATAPARLWSRIFGEIVTPALNKEYLIITHSFFEPAALRLGSYRSRERNGSFALARVEDLYDYFSFGEFDPLAIKEFVREVYDGSSQRPVYLLLMGDANWDYKNRRQTHRKNFVPTYGFPISDSWFSAFDSTHIFFPYLHTGRLPVKTVEEAERIVDKIISYDSDPHTPRSKRFMIMTSGITEAESNFFKSWADGLFQNYVIPPPVGGQPVRVYGEAGTQLDFSTAGRVKQAIDSGAAWVNYLGHGGTTLWGNGITSPSQLNNEDRKSMLVTDLSCSTVRFAEPDVESLAEQMLFDDGGAIAFMGMSGFGFLSALSTLGSGIYQAILQDTVREFGKALTAAKFYLWETYGRSPSNLILRSTLAQYTLLGDPAQRFRLPVASDLVVSTSDIKVQPSEPTESDNTVSVQLAFWNFGLIPFESVDSLVQVSIRHQRENTVLMDSTVFRPIPGLGDTLIVTLPLRALTGEHSLRVRLVLPPSYQDADTTNNSVTIRFYVYSNQIAIVKPLPFQEIGAANIVLSVQNPGRTQQVEYLVQFELDTIPGFSSPWKRTQTIPPGYLVTRWSIPETLQPREYFWRARTISHDLNSSWVNGRFHVAQRDHFSWSQLSSSSFEAGTLTNVRYNNGIRLEHPRLPVTVVSGGHCNGGTAAVSIGGVEVLANLARDGYNVVAIDKFTGNVRAILSPGAFWRGDAAGKAAAIGSLIKSEPVGTYFLVAVMDEGGLSKPDTMNKAMEAIGSNLIRTVNLWDSWAIIGRKGAAKGSVPEGIKHAYPYVVAPDGSWQCNPETPESLLTPTIVHDTLEIFVRRGVILSPVIGPASAWMSFQVDVDTSQPGTSFQLNLVRIRLDGSRDTLNNVSFSDSSLGSLVDAREFPYIQLMGVLLDDDGQDSPVLRSWKVNFGPPPNLVLNYQSVVADRQAVMEGETIRITAATGNIGHSAVDSAQLEFSLRRTDGVEQQLTRVVLGRIEVDSVRSADYSLNTTGHRGEMSIVVRVLPQTLPFDISNRDNQFSVPVTIFQDTIRPSVDVTFDGVRIFDGDYVSAQPAIQALVYDNSPLPINDPNKIVLRLNNRRVNLGSTPDSLFESRSGPEKAIVVFRPLLPKGEHTLSLQVYDATGNPVDTAAREFRFRVETQARLLNVLTIPNPFSDETHFTFNLVGGKLPDEVFIKIYAVSGRQIHEIRLARSELRFGFNKVYWNGRDKDGDPVANGVYLYKMGMNIDGHREEVIQKLAKVK
jgi:hypothetical protein